MFGADIQKETGQFPAVFNFRHFPSGYCDPVGTLGQVSYMEGRMWQNPECDQITTTGLATRDYSNN